MQRQQLERHQVWGYLAAILAGLGVGSAAPEQGPLFEGMLWPALGLLLYATFTQVPLTRLPAAFRDRRFIAAVMTGNFVALPLLVWALLALLPPDPAVRLGVLLVLLVPCTDWFITFTHLGGGDTGRAIAITPVNLGAQLVLLPLYLWLFMGPAFTAVVEADTVARAVLLLIVLPLLMAWLTERWAERRGNGAALVERLAWLPVPLLALVVFLIAAAQVQTVQGSLAVLGQVLLVFILFLLAAAAIGVWLGRWFGLAPAPRRALVFSLGSRNSFVVLPVALALPASWDLAVVVIVFQSLVELFGMVAYLWVVPRYLVPNSPLGVP